MSRLGRSLALAATVLGAMTAVVAGPSVSPAAAATGDIGYNDGSFAPLGGSPSGTKPESKLWFNDGSWSGVLFSPAKNRYEIFTLDRTTGRWSDTGTAADPRTASRADTLWDAGAGKLYIASHYFKDAGHGATAPAVTAGTGARLYRYSYSGGAYTLDAGYPADINAVKTETLTIDKDSTGTLWATWTYGNRVYVNHTVGGNDASWSAPYVVPGAGTSLDSDDISSLIHFGGTKIGVMWSNQADGKEYFSVHEDGAGDAAWSTSVVPTGWSSDDHINLKADSAGRVYAAVKTSESTNTKPLILLLVRGTDGVWKSYVYGLDQDSNTRPIVLLDEQHRVIHLYATGPQPPSTSGQSGGDIVEKTTSMDAIAFPAGAGTPLIRANGSPKMNDATSTKQNVNDATGIVVLANDHALSNYWHSQQSLGSTPAPALAAAFSGTPVSGVAPLTVQFTDTSTGGPIAWGWDFGDGSASSSLQSPSHTYTTPGTYTVKLTVSDGRSFAATTKTGYITVDAPGGGGGGGGATVTLQPSADAYVQDGSPTKNYGTQTSLRVRGGGSPFYKSYVAFDLSGVSGTVTSAKLRLFTTDPSPYGGQVYPVPAASWTESGITFNNAPALANPIGLLGATTASTWAELNVTSAVQAGGKVSFGLDSTSTNSAYYSAKEGTNPPQLVVTTG